VSARLRRGRFGLLEPLLYEPGAGEIAAAVRGHVAAFTPEWHPSPDDPGHVLIQLFGEMTQEAADRARGLPEKARVELLRVAGIESLPATPASALVVFDVAPTAPESVVVPRGFQLGARPAAEGEMVVFETERALLAAPGKVAQLASVRGNAFRDLTAQNADPTVSFLPFGLRPRVGDALLLGIDGDTAPTGTITVGIGVTRPPGAPAPVAEGGLYPVPLTPSVQLSWDALDGVRWVALELVGDETRQLSRTGVLELKLPELFRPGRPRQSAEGPPRRWIRVRIVAGAFSAPPALDFVRTNAVTATAGRTVLDEVLAPVAGSPGRFRLSANPVLAGSLVLDVNDGSGFRQWEEVEDLSTADPQREAFTLDAATGEVTFGDDVHGRAVPAGVRQVRARSYRFGGTGAALVKAAAVKTLLGSVASVMGVTNPRAASGGDAQEGVEATVRRGPDLIRAHGRAVLPSDYELLALRSPGARVRRVHAMPGRHPAMPTARIAGVVGLLVVPPIEEGAGDGPPLPDEDTLRNVARHVSAKLAPAGVEIVAGAPVYHLARIEAQVRLREGIDQGAAVADVLAEIDRYLHPLSGGDVGAGWPFGGTLRYDALLRRLLGRDTVLAVPRLAMIVDGRRVPPCQDRAIGPHDLLWPSGHLVIPVEGAR
jgi:predicted phage baseplate assembly protein